jgi:hypothetical protein
MKRNWVFFLLMFSLSLSQNLLGQDGSVIGEQNLVDGYIDHVVVTLPSRQYMVLDSFLTAHFGYCWMKQQGKGFIFSASQRPYVEIWDAGIFYQFGNQIAFGSTQKDAKEKAIKYYGNGGLDFPGVFTVGRDGQAGHPVGGTFFVDYGGGGLIPVNDSMKIEKFCGLITTISEIKKDIIDDYRFFHLSADYSDGIYTLKDPLGFTVTIVEQPVESIVFGHVALKFKLKNGIPGHEEYPISGFMKAIIDDRDLLIVLNIHTYNTVAGNL